MGRRPGHIRRFLQEKRTVRYILVAGLAIRLISFVFFDLSGQAAKPFSGDAIEYMVAAQQLTGEAEFSPYWPPGVPVYLVIWSWLGEMPGNGIPWKLIFIPWFLTLFWGVWKLGSRFLNREATHLALIAISVYPEMIHQSLHPLSQLPAAALLVWAVYHFLAAVDDGRRHWVWAGIFAGLLIWFRPAAILIPAGLAVWMLLRKRKAREFAGFLLPAMIIPAIWILFVFAQTGRWVYMNDANARNFFLGNNRFTPVYATWELGSRHASAFGPEVQKYISSFDSLPPVQQNQAFRQAALSHISEKPGLFVRRSFNRAGTFLAADTFTGTYLRAHYFKGKASLLLILTVSFGFLIYFIFSGAAILLRHEKNTQNNWKLVLIIGFLFSFPYLISFAHPFFHLPLLPLVFLAGSSFLVEKRSGFLKLKMWGWFRILGLLIFVWIQVRWAIYLWNEFYP